MARQDNLSLQFLSAGQGRVEVADFKPQEHTISRRDAGIANATVMMLLFPAMQLKHHPSLRNEPLIVWAAVVTPTAQEPLIPATARLNIAHADQGLWVHAKFVA